MTVAVTQTHDQSGMRVRRATGEIEWLMTDWES